MRTGTAWLDHYPAESPLRREQALLVQNILYVALFVGVVSVLSAFVAASLIDRITILVSTVPVIILLSVAVVMLRRGALMTAVILTTISVTLGAVTTMLPTGLEGSRAILLMLVVPLLLSGLIVSTRMLWINTALVIGCVASLILLERLVPWLVGFSPDTYDPLLTVIVFAILIVFIALIIDRFGRAFRLSMSHLLHREHELEQLHDSLEQQVKARTVDLTRALRDVETQSAAQAQLLAQVEAQQVIIRQMSVPVLPVGGKTLIMPLVGALDTERMHAIQQEALSAIERQQARRLLLDLTGVPIIDTNIAQGLFGIIQAAKLLGTDAILIGIRPEVAQTMVALGIDFSEISVARDLASVLAVGI